MKNRTSGLFTRLTRALAAMVGSLWLTVGLTTAAAAMEMVVIAQTNSPLTVGQILDGKQPISLPTGATVTLLTSSGEVVALTGPYSGVPAPADAAPQPGVIKSIGDMLRQDTRHSGDVGTVRASGRSRCDVPSPWALCVETTGGRCLPNPSGESAVLWRANGDREAEMQLSETGSARRSWTRSWHGGASTLRLPPTRFRDGAVYEIKLADGYRMVNNSLTLHVMPADLADNKASQLSWMLKKGCRNQARALLGSLR